MSMVILSAWMSLQYLEMENSAECTPLQKGGNFEKLVKSG